MEKAFQEIVLRLKEMKLDENILCSPYWKKILRVVEMFESSAPGAEDTAWDLFTDSFQWVMANGLVTGDELQAWFDDELLMSKGVYISKTGLDLIDKRALLIDCQAEIKGHSLVSCFGEKSFIDSFDTSFVTISGGSITVKDGIVFAFGRTHVFASGYSKVEAFDNCNCHASEFSYLICGYDVSRTASGNAVVHVRPRITKV